MNVRELREKSGLSQQELATATGIPKDRIAKWEQGKGTPKAEDSKVLNNYFKDYLPQNATRNAEAPQILGKSQETDKYLALLEKSLKGLEIDKTALAEYIKGLQADKHRLEQRVAELEGKVSSDLEALLAGNKSVLAHVSVILDKLCEMEAGGNLELAARLKHDVDIRAVAKLSGTVKMDNPQSIALKR